MQFVATLECTPPPSAAKLPVTVQLTNVLPLEPPPLRKAWFAVSAQLMSVLSPAPPPRKEVFPERTQRTRVQPDAPPPLEVWSLSSWVTFPARVQSNKVEP